MFQSGYLVQSPGGATISVDGRALLLFVDQEVAAGCAAEGDAVNEFSIEPHVEGTRWYVSVWSDGAAAVGAFEAKPGGLPVAANCVPLYPTMRACWQAIAANGLHARPHAVQLRGSGQWVEAPS